MKVYLVLLGVISISSCSVSTNPMRTEARRLQKGITKEDTSYVYALPYEKGTSHLLIQGYYSAFSHKHRAALDFKMKRGTTVLAARDGVVVRAREDNNKGGWNRKYRQFANYLIIEHADGTRAGYWHLQQNGVLVNPGDTVKQGQPIALSGKTGYSATPHLHFMVWSTRNGQWQQVPTRFNTVSGPGYLKPFKKHKSR